MEELKNRPEYDALGDMLETKKADALFANSIRQLNMKIEVLKTVCDKYGIHLETMEKDSKYATIYYPEILAVLIFSNAEDRDIDNLIAHIEKEHEKVKTGGAA